MTQRIDGPRVPRPAPGVASRAGAAAGAKEAIAQAGTSLDTKAAHAALSSVAAGALPAAPGLALGAAAQGVQSLGQKLLSFFGDAVPGTLGRVVLRPLIDLAWGVGEKLEIASKDQFPTAKAESWRGVPLAAPFGRDPIEDQAVTALIADVLRGAGQDDHGLTPARAAAARVVAAKLRDAFGPAGAAAFADPARLQAIAARGTEILVHTVPPEDHPLADLDALPGPIAGALAAIRKGLETAYQDGLVRRLVAVETLPEPTRARVDALRAPFADSPRVLEALDGLVADGRLPQAAAGGGTLLDHLETLATGALDKSVEKERSDLLGEVILEVHNSGSVAQRGMNTCGASSAQAHLVYRDPAEYVRLIAGLASPAGAVKTAGGVALARDEKWDLDCDTQRKTGIQRTLSCRLIQPALMDVGAISNYDNETDQDRTWIAKMGTKPAGVVRQMEAVTGQNWGWTATSTGIGRNQVADRIKGASLDHPVIVAMNYNDEGEVAPAFHWIRVVGFDKAKDEVIIRNTQRGTEEHIAYGEFRERMFVAVHAQ